MHPEKPAGELKASDGWAWIAYQSNPCRSKNIRGLSVLESAFFYRLRRDTNAAANIATGRQVGSGMAEAENETLFVWLAK